MWMMRSNQLCDLGFSHTHICRGGGEGGREQGQPATTNNGETKDNTTKAENKQREHTTSRQNKERKGGKAGGRKHTGTQPWHAKEQAPPSTTGNKAKPQQWRKVKQDSTGKEQTHS